MNTKKVSFEVRTNFRVYNILIWNNQVKLNVASVRLHGIAVSVKSEEFKAV